MFSIEASKILYPILLALRFITTLWPQSGYIHPDEFFQSPEIVYGDVFGLTSLRTWEFKVDNPIRSIIFPYFTTGIPALFMDHFGAKALFGTKFFPYMLLVLPRLLMCFVSLLHDVCLYKVSQLLSKNPYEVLTIFSSAYVTIVYLTRTFSNSIEAACFTLLNYLVINEFIELRHCAKLTEKQRNNYMQERDDIYYAYGVIVAIGVFVRPTFAVFAMTPIIFWFLVCLKTENRMSKCAHFTIAAFITSLILSFLDTVYYNNEFDHLLNAKSIALSLENMVYTPLNFVAYNLNFEKISTHGCHPWYLHFAANVPVMFSLLGLYGLVHFANVLVTMARRVDLNVSALELFLLLSFAAPVAFLSFIPHQEPRFLMPLICPLIVLYGERLYAHCFQYKLIGFIWLVSNAIGIIFFGFFHQGGLISTLTYLHTSSAKSMPVGSDLVFYHTYMPPRHLLAMDDSQNLITVHDLAGASDEKLLTTVRDIISKSSLERKLYLIIPSSVTIPVVNVNIMLSPHYKMKLERKFFPHVSMEDFPVLYNLWGVATSNSTWIYKARKLRDFFCLNLYRVEPAVAT